MAQGGRDNLSDPVARALPYACVATVLTIALGALASGRIGRVSAALALLALATLYAWRWVRARAARFDALRSELERDPRAARETIDALIAAQKGARMFDPFVWRLALLDAWRAGAFDRYAAVADAQVASLGPRAAPEVASRAHASVAFARALGGALGASRAAIERSAVDPSAHDDPRDGRATVCVARALLHLREGRVEEAKETLLPMLSSLSAAEPEANEVALAILGAQRADAVVAQGYRGAIGERLSARDEALGRAFPAVKFAVIEALDPEDRPPPSLEVDPAARAAALPAPVRSRVDPIAWAPAPAVVGVAAMVASELGAPWAAGVAIAMGALVLLAVLVDRGRAAPDRARTELALRATRDALDAGGAVSEPARAALERVASGSTALLAGEACALRSRIARDEADFAGALSWAQQGLARLHTATALRAAVARLRAEMVETAMLALAALGARAEAERYARLFDAPHVVRAQLAAVRFIDAARSPREAEARGYARLAARYSSVPQVQLLAHLVISVGSPAREEACRVALRCWPQGRAWVEAVAPAWAAKVIAPVRVALDAERADEGEAREDGRRQGGEGGEGGAR